MKLLALLPVLALPGVVQAADQLQQMQSPSAGPLRATPLRQSLEMQRPINREQRGELLRGLATADQLNSGMARLGTILR